jgi:hypothetical protein
MIILTVSLLFFTVCNTGSGNDFTGANGNKEKTDADFGTWNEWLEIYLRR